MLTGKELFNKDIEDINIGDIQELIENEVIEDDYLEYKTLNGSEKKFKDFKNRKKLLKEVCAFINAEGGLLIYGVADLKHMPSEIVGMELNPDVDLLSIKDIIKKDLSPKIKVSTTFKMKTLHVQDKLYILVIKIKKGDNTPYKSLENNEFYIREGSSSVPMDPSEILEYERNKSEILDITSRFKHYLSETDDWNINFDKTKKAFNKKHPEFKIEISERGDMLSIEPYCTFFFNNESKSYDVKFEYNSTQLFAEEELFYIVCDGYRSHFPEPSMKVFDFDYPKKAFYYYNLEEVQGLFGELCKKTKPENFIMDRGYEELPFLVFNDSNELDDFTNFLTNDMNRLENIKINFQFNNWDPMEYNLQIDLEIFLKVKQIYDLYKKRKL